MTTFKIYFTQLQEDQNRLHGLLLRIRNTDQETAGKLSKAIMAAVDAFRKKVET